MPATNSFFDWFFYGLNGLGGWFIFLLLAAAAVAWLYYDSFHRKLAVPGWRVGVILAAVLLLPTMLYRFTSSDPASPLAQYGEPIFYIGILGGTLPLILVLGYFISYQGMPAAAPQPEPPVVPAANSPTIPPSELVTSIKEEPSKPVVLKAPAWLITSGGEFQLNQGVTTIGRSIRNDISFGGDSTLSKEHAKILEQNGHYRLVDLGSTNGTRVNGRLVREQVLLESDDEIKFGDNTTARFMSADH